jgi:hypothetical protein
MWKGTFSAGLRQWNENHARTGSTSDLRQKSFLFTLKNSHNIPAKRVALNATKQRAFCCYEYCDPSFGDDIHVWEQCLANTISSSSKFIGRDGGIVFTGSNDFQVKEIEVFEITD